MSNGLHYEVAAGDSIAIPVGADIITTESPIDAGWECYVSLKPYDSDTLTFAAREETRTNTGDTKYIVSLTTTETDQEPGVYDVVVQLRQDAAGFRKTDLVGLTITTKLIA